MGMHPSMMALTVAGIIYILWKAQGAEACMPGNLNQGIHGLPTFKDTQETKTPPKPSASAGAADEADTSDTSEALSRSRTMARGSKTITEIINDVREKTEEELELELKAKLEELERKRKEREFRRMKEEEDAEKVADGTKNDGGEIKPENEGSGHGADAGGDKSDGHVSEVTLEENKQPTLKVRGSSIQTTIRRYNRRTERREIV